MRRQRAARLRLLFPSAQAFEEVPFEEMVDQAPLLGKNAFDDFPWQVPVRNAIPANAQAVVADQFLPKWNAIATLFSEAAQAEPDFSPLRTHGANTMLDIFFISTGYPIDFYIA
jgi:hypothetical protein